MQTSTCRSADVTLTQRLWHPGMNLSTEYGEARFPGRDAELLFRHPREVLTASAVGEVRSVLEAVESAVAKGCHAAGLIAYEAAPAFDPAFRVHPNPELPLLWFGLYDAFETHSPATASLRAHAVGAWNLLLDRPAYDASIARIREHIAAGDTYQVNFTFPMRAPFEGDALGWFRALCAAQRADYCAFIDMGRFKVLSISPELFFDLHGDIITTRPMKGTRPRGRWPEEDLERAQELRSSNKDRAENVMIVDLLRNDLGRICETGSVAVQRLFDVERYETVWQMTSTITGRTAAGLAEIFRALFPCGSVTGAPKIETMRIIREVEPHPRGVYCGAIGWCSPGRRARFNVAIRTVVVDTEKGEAQCHVGGGITWDSSADLEYEECRTKAAFLTLRRPEFALLESLLYDGDYFLLEAHLRRLAASATYFGYPVDVDMTRRRLMDYAKSLGKGAHKVRLLLHRQGKLHIERAPVTPERRVRVTMASFPVDSNNIFLYHKTTHREVYERAKAARPDCDDVILWNERGEITESTVANIVLDMDGALLTPPRSAGLLAGTFRAYLLETGAIREAILRKEDIARARERFLINSVRQWMKTDWIDHDS